MKLIELEIWVASFRIGETDIKSDVHNIVEVDVCVCAVWPQASL